MKLFSINWDSLQKNIVWFKSEQQQQDHNDWDQIDYQEVQASCQSMWTCNADDLYDKCNQYDLIIISTHCTFK